MLPGVIFVKVLESLDISERRSLVVYEIRVRIFGVYGFRDGNLKFLVDDCMDGLIERYKVFRMQGRR